MVVTSQSRASASAAWVICRAFRCDLILEPMSVRIGEVIFPPEMRQFRASQAFLKGKIAQYAFMIDYFVVSE
jgi:hypothetical protein